MFTRIAIDNFRCFQNFEIRPERINLLLGDNGSGKSSVFDAIAAVVDLIIQGQEVGAAFPNHSRTRWDTRARQRVEFDVLGPYGTYTYVLVISHGVDSNDSLLHEEVVLLEGRTLFSYTAGAVHLHNNEGVQGTSFSFRGSRSFLAQIDDRPETRDLMWFLKFLSGTWLLRLNARSMLGSTVEEDSSLDTDGSNFASWYRHLAQEAPENLAALWRSLRTVVPGLTSLKLISSGGRGRVRDLAASLLVGSTSYELAFEELSDGQRALIVLYTLLCGVRVEQSALLLDEPEAHVGLREIQPWLLALDDQRHDQGQVFIISHHPDAIDFLAAGAGYLFSRPDGGPVRVQPAVFDRASGLSASKQLTRGLVDGV